MDQLQTLMDILFKRRSIRRFQDNKPIEREKLTTLLQAAMAAPSACNLQPWEFIVIDDPGPLKRLKECIGIDNGRHYNAAAAMVVCANTHYIPPEWHSRGDSDTSAAIENMLLAACAMGLGAVWIGDIDPDATRAAFNIPPHVSVNSAVLFGYPAEEKKPRTQYTEEAVYFNKYDPDREHPGRATAMRFL